MHVRLGLLELEMTTARWARKFKTLFGVAMFIVKGMTVMFTCEMMKGVNNF